MRETNVLNDVNDRTFEEFHQKLGQKMKYLSFKRKLIDLNLFPNIERVMIGSVQKYFFVPYLNLAQLKQLRLAFDYRVRLEEHMLQTFIDSFPTLTHFCLNVCDYSEGNAIYNPLKNISNLKNLIHFEFHFYCGTNNNQIYGFLKQLENICLNLKSIDCRLIITDKDLDLRQIFWQLKAFPVLKRLDLRFYSSGNEGNGLFTFALFEGLLNITHLSLSFPSTTYLKESKLDINLPKLQYLDIKTEINATSKEVTQMADILSRLSRLQTLKLKFKSGVNFKPIEEQIIKKCRKIKEIKIEKRIKHLL